MLFESCCRFLPICQKFVFILPGHIARPHSQLALFTVARWLNSNQWSMNRDDMCHFLVWSIKASHFHALSPFQLTRLENPGHLGSCVLKMAGCQIAWRRATLTVMFMCLKLLYDREMNNYTFLGLLFRAVIIKLT